MLKPHSVSQSARYSWPQVVFCSHCGTRYYIGYSVWNTIQGPCDCSWSCCDKTSDCDHAPHMQNRDATETDFQDMGQGKVRDFMLQS